MTQETHSPGGQLSAPAAPPTKPLLLVVAGILSSLLWLGVVGQLVVIVPRCERLLSDFRTNTPPLMTWVIQNARWAIPAVAVATVLFCFAVGRRSLWPWLFLWFLLPLALNVFLGVSVYLPLIELLEGLSGGKK